MPVWFIEHQNIIAQCIGFAAMVLGILSYQWNDRRKLLLVQLAASALWTAHYCVLGAETGMVLNAIAIARCVVFANKDKKWAANKIWIAVFVTAFIVSGVLTWADWSSALPMAAMVILTFSGWMTNPKLLRRLSFPGSAFWLTYNIINGSVAGAADELFVMTSIIVATLRYDVRHKRKNAETEDAVKAAE